MSDVITKVSEILDKIKATGNIKVKFIKKDGTDRVMSCTLDFGRIPKEHYPKKVDASVTPKVIEGKSFLRVYDLEKSAWRGFIINSLEWLSVDGRVYEIQLEEEKMEKPEPPKIVHRKEGQQPKK